MKLPSALITISAAIGLRTNGVTGASIVDRHVKSMTTTHLFPGEKFGVDIDASEKSWSEIATTRKDRSFGSGWLGKAFIRVRCRSLLVYILLILIYQVVMSCTT
jgi:hypothetical protein